MNSLLNLVILTLGLSRFVSAQDYCRKQYTSIVQPMEICVETKWWLDSLGHPKPPLGATEPPFKVILRHRCCFALERMCVRNKLFTPECRTQTLSEYIEIIDKDCKDNGINVRNGTAVQDCAQEVPKSQGVTLPSCVHYQPCTDYSFNIPVRVPDIPDNKPDPTPDNKPVSTPGPTPGPDTNHKPDSNFGRIPVPGCGHILFLILILFTIVFILI